VKEVSIARPSIWSGRELPSNGQAVIPGRSFALTSVGWRRCAGPAIRCGSTPIIGASPPIFPRAVIARDRANIRISVLSHNGLDQQIRSDGATWLDRELASPSLTTLANTGFGREITEAMERRSQRLVNMGHAIRLEDGRIRVSKDFIANLERTEVTRVGKAMAAERGLTFTAAKTGEYVSGTLIGSAQLASGRFAMIDDGIGFQLVPWQPVLDKRIGQHITGTVRNAGGIEWSFGRNRGLAR